MHFKDRVEIVYAYSKVMASYRRSKATKNIYKVILLGNYGVGKSSLFRRLMDGSYDAGDDDGPEDIGQERCSKSFTMDNGETVRVRCF